MDILGNMIPFHCIAFRSAHDYDLHKLAGWFPGSWVSIGVSRRAGWHGISLFHISVLETFDFPMDYGAYDM